MGGAGESRNTSHQQKKLDVEALKAFRDRFALPLDDEQLGRLSFFRPTEDSAEIRYLRARRTELGGPIPARHAGGASLSIPPIDSYAGFALEADGKEMSTTMAVIRLLTGLLRDKTLAPHIVPIVADEARTFGMANLFRQIGIYAPDGQLYLPEDAGSMLSYREARDGQILEEGITEAGAMSSWIAAATSYSVHGITMFPFYIYYSMFGFQRVGDLIWAAADQRARGFLVGATAGRTTLGGEGLQHQDGSSHLIASTIPNCRAYDPAFAAEMAVIFDHGARQMFERGEDVFYYLTAMNENYANPSIRPADAEGIIKGMYRYSAAREGKPAVRLLGSGAILREVIAAAELLGSDWQIETEVWSVTSFSELGREAREAERFNRLHPKEPATTSYVAQCLAGGAPVVAATDYVAAYPSLVAGFLDAPFTALGTDGFGRSDTRTALRKFFEVDSQHIALAALRSLVSAGSLRADVLEAAIARYGIGADTKPPWSR
jgi:pyruvate dehydrogenase E1 component